VEVAMEVIILILGMLGGFAAGLFVATDKNRHALFQAKLESHRKLSHAIATTYVCGLDFGEHEELKEAHEKSLFNLTQLLLSETMFMPKGMVEYLTDFISLPVESYTSDENKVSEMLSLLRNDLGIKGLELMNQLSSLTHFLKHKKSEPK